MKQRNRQDSPHSVADRKHNVAKRIEYTPTTIGPKSRRIRVVLLIVGLVAVMGSIGLQFMTSFGIWNWALLLIAVVFLQFSRHY